MPIEIERKFLVFRDRLPRLDAYRSRDIEQAYLAAMPTIRVRRREDGSAGMTVKGYGTLMRPEFVYGIPKEDFEELAAMSPWPRVRKRRYQIPNGRTLEWELDIFTELNEGLCIAEIEFNGTEVRFDRPDWIAEEVTEDLRFQNVALAQWPFTTWPERLRRAVHVGRAPSIVRV